MVFDRLADKLNDKWATQEEPLNEQRLDKFAYILGFALAGSAFCFCLGAEIFVFRNRVHPIVSMGQPLFLYFVCLGSSCFAFSIAFQSFDDYRIENENVLDAMCMLQVWMAYGGQIIVYMALFCKLWRVKKICGMRKRRVLPRHVIWPFLLFIATSFGILVAWTITNPTKFNRLEVGVEDDFFAEPTSYPTCTYEIGYQSASQVPLFVSMAILWYMSHKTRAMPERLTDSRKIAQVLLSHVLITTVAIVLIAIALRISSFNFVYLVRVFANFFYALFTIGLLVFPKFRDIQRGTGEREFGGSVTVTGLDEDDLPCVQPGLDLEASQTRTSCELPDNFPSPGLPALTEVGEPVPDASEETDIDC